MKTELFVISSDFEVRFITEVSDRALDLRCDNMLKMNGGYFDILVHQSCKQRQIIYFQLQWEVLLFNERVKPTSTKWQIDAIIT